MEDDKRPFLRDIWEQTHFHVGTLTRLVMYDQRTILRMLRGWPVCRKKASEVLQGLSILLKKDYSLENVRVVLKDSSQP